jgi:hypothetical protein
LLASARSAGHPIWHLAVVALGAIAVFVGIKIREHLDAHERARSKPARLLARGGLLFTLALCSAGAATIHAVVCPEHFREYVAFGAFFAVAAALQGAWAVVALLRPTRALLVVGAAGNAAVILVWAVSRTAGLPIGPEVWQPEAISVLDVVAALLEVGLVLGASFLLTRREATAPRSDWRASHLVS